MYHELSRISTGRKIHFFFRLSMMHIRREMGKIGFGAGDYAFLTYLFNWDGISQGKAAQNIRGDKSLTERVLAKQIEDAFIEMFKHWDGVLLKDIT